MVVELLGAEAFLAMTGENGLYGGVAPFYSLQRRKRGVDPLLGKMIQNCMGFIARLHGPYRSRRPCGYHRVVAAPAKKLDIAIGDLVEIDDPRTAGVFV